jgi:hypothetical protein
MKREGEESILYNSWPTEPGTLSYLTERSAAWRRAARIAFNRFSSGEMIDSNTLKSLQRC